MKENLKKLQEEVLREDSMFYNWARLNENCPLDIKDLCDMGWNLHSDINAIKRGARDMESIFFVRSKLDRIIKRFLGIISEFNGENGHKKQLKVIEHEFREAYARILGNLDNKETELKSRQGIKEEIALPLLISDIESILVGDVYDPIRIAGEKYPDKNEEFIYKVFELVNKQAQIFGGETRFKPTKGKKIFSEPNEATLEPPMTGEELMDEKGQDMLKEKYKKTFGFEELKEADDRLKSKKIVQVQNV